VYLPPAEKKMPMIKQPCPARMFEHRIMIFGPTPAYTGAFCANRISGGLLAALLTMIVIGCAGTGLATHSPQWQCDPAADAAVERGEWQEAREAHEKFLVHEPGNGLALYHLGYIMSKLGNQQAEIDFYLRAIAFGYDRDDQLFFNLGMAYGESNPTAAIEAFGRAISLDPESADNHFGLALMAYTLGRNEQAVKVLQRALVLQPDHLDAMLLLSRLYLDLSRWADAIAMLDSILALDPGNEEALGLLGILVSRRHLRYEEVDNLDQLK
jgi:tetratricopeptide (TPR) repeat protein